jgi:hypothetical protein
MKSMDQGNRQFVIELLERMDDANELVLERNEQWYVTMIALPDSLPTPAKEETEVPAPRGMNKTVAARSGDGKELPSHLPDDMVGPVETTYSSEEAGKEIEATARLVLEGLVKEGKARISREQLLAEIRGVVQTLHTGQGTLTAAVIDAISLQVLGWLCDNKHIRREDRREKGALYNVQLPQTLKPTAVAQPILTKDEAIAQLMERVRVLNGQLEEEKATSANLQRQLDEFEKQQITPALFQQLLARAEQQQKAINELQRQIKDANAAHQKEIRELKQGHEHTLEALRETHRSELTTASRKLTDTEKELRRLEGELKKAQGGATLDATTAQRLAALGIQ